MVTAIFCRSMRVVERPDDGVADLSRTLDVALR
jgi:hypothetical protein